MYIGQVSKITQATPRAIRLYEKLGLIPKPIRKGKYRYYDNRDIELIKIIKEAQKVGFKLSEMKELLNNDVSCDDFPWLKAKTLIKKKIYSIKIEVEKLEELNINLKRLMATIKEKI